MQKRKSLTFQVGSHEIALEPRTPIEYFEEAARVSVAPCRPQQRVRLANHVIGRHKGLEPGQQFRERLSGARVMSIVGYLEGEPRPRVDEDTL